MPIWFELMILMLFAYAVGLGIGWALWNRTPTDELPATSQQGTDPE